MKHLKPSKIVLIGASTGGPGEIQKIVKSLPILKDTSIIIAQHMVQGFMQSFKAQLQNISQNKICVVEDSQNFETAIIYICDEEIILNGDRFSKKPSAKNSYNPNINKLFSSFKPSCRDTQIACIILTGIGDDGVNACKELFECGARIITQDQSAIVDGMPSRVRGLDIDVEVYDMQTMIKNIVEFCS